MATKTGVFLPDEQEQQTPKKSPQSVLWNSDEAKRVEPAKTDYADPAKLNEQELKAAIVSAWKKHEALAKAELAPLLYWLRERLRAQGARNDLTNDKDRGWEVWVTEHLEISRRTADRWCAWYAEEAGLNPDATPGQVTGSDEDEFFDIILKDHKSTLLISVNYRVPKALHAQYNKALMKLQTKLGLKNKKEALVRGVIYAATVIDKGAVGRRNAGVVGKLSVSHGRQEHTVRGRRKVRGSVRATLIRPPNSASRECCNGGGKPGTQNHSTQRSCWTNISQS